MGWTKPRVTSEAVFIVIWAATAGLFLVQAWAAYRDQSTVLPPYSVSIPPSYNLQIGGVRFQDVINGLIAAYNTNVAALEVSIRASARLSFELNMTSAGLALMGLAAQIRQAVRRLGNAA